MLMFDIPFGTTEWDGVDARNTPAKPARRSGAPRNFNNIRVRMVEYTPGYLADHWCQKGHVLLVLEGELSTELADGRTVVLKVRPELPGGRWHARPPFAHRQGRQTFHSGLT